MRLEKLFKSTSACMRYSWAGTGALNYNADSIALCTRQHPGSLGQEANTQSGFEGC